MDAKEKEVLTIDDVPFLDPVFSEDEDDQRLKIWNVKSTLEESIFFRLGEREKIEKP